MLRRASRVAARRGGWKRRGVDVVVPPVAVGRVPKRSGRVGGRSAIPPPQTYYDQVAAESADANNHPSLGPYTSTAVQNGLWSDPATWGGTVPQAGARVNVGGYLVTYDVEMPSDASAIETIHISGTGTLKWATNKDTRLYVDSIMVHGNFIMGSIGNPIEESATHGKPRAQVLFKRLVAPGVTTRLGLMTMGPIRMLGAEKRGTLKASSTIAAGATSINVENLSGSGWRVGDLICIVATSKAPVTNTDPTYNGPTSYRIPGIDISEYNNTTQGGWGFHGSHDEIRKIASISGNTITLASAPIHDGSDSPIALSYAHELTTETLPHGQAISVKPRISNLSRSIRFETFRPASDSANTYLLDNQNRAHMMFMHNDDVDIRYVETFNMARSDTDPSLVVASGSAITDASGNPIADALNVRGRYSFHIHGTGPYFARKQVNLIGCVSRGQTGPSMSAIPMPGWAYTHHTSRCAIEDCVSYNVRGAGFVSELGNEIGQWIDCSAIWCRGDGFSVNWNERQELIQNHNGHAGVGFENQARQIINQGGVVSSSHIGWLYLQQVRSALERIPQTYSLRLFDPVQIGANHLGDGSIYDQDTETYGIEQAQIPDFNDNTCFGVRDGFFVSHRAHTDRTETTPMVSRHFHCINTQTPIFLSNYSFFYSYYDFVWTGTGGNSACHLGEVSWQWMFVNGKIKNFSRAFNNGGQGFNYNGFWVDIQTENVANFSNGFSADWNISAWKSANPTKTFPQDHAMFNLMGPWITNTALSEPNVTNKWVGTLREWKSLDSATDLPQPYPASPRGPGGVQPLPGAQKPYIAWENTDISMAGVSSIGIKGTLVDRVGSRWWPDWFSSESFGPTTNGPTRPVKMAKINATECAIRNGCFNDGGIWKSRVWFVEHDRLTGEYLIMPLDITLTGVSQSILDENVVDPDSTKPQMPLALEEVGDSPSITVIEDQEPTEPDPVSNSWTPEQIAGSLYAWVSADQSEKTLNGNRIAAIANVSASVAGSGLMWGTDSQRPDLVDSALGSATKAMRFDTTRGTVLRTVNKVPGNFSNLLAFIVVNPFVATPNSNRFVSFVDNDTNATKEDWNSAGAMAVLTQWSGNRQTHITQNSVSNSSRVPFLMDTAQIMGTVMRSRVTFSTVNGTRSSNFTISEGQLVPGYFHIARQGINNNAMDGHIWEVILSTQSISDSDVGKIEGYLAHKYGLTAGLPSNHPYKNAAPTI